MSSLVVANYSLAVGSLEVIGFMDDGETKKKIIVFLFKSFKFKVFSKGVLREPSCWESCASLAKVAGCDV